MAADGDVRQRVYALAHRDLDTAGLFRSTVEVLRRAVPVDRWCALTLDPDTLVPTGGVHDEGVPADLFPRLLELEHAAPDPTHFPELARTRSGVGVLSRHDGAANPRFLDVLQPSGFSDELRVALRADGRTWGGLVLFREGGDFDAADARLLADVAVYLGAAVRRSLVRGRLEATHRPDGPGVLVVDGDRVEAATTAARAWLDDLPEIGAGPDGLPPLVHALVRHARRAASDPAVPPARARTRTLDGRWLLLHAALLDEDRVAVTIDPADTHEVVPLLMEGHGLTAREREVVQLLLQGRSTREIATTLFVSPHTVQDHLKSIFDKVGVRSRREVVTELLGPGSAAPTTAG